MTGAVFIDLTTANDTINHRTLFKKTYDITNDFNLTAFIAEMLRNRRYFVELQGKKSRWRTQKNGLAQGSVLAPLLFNIYTNEKPTPLETQRFIYADDLALIAQNHSFENIETTHSNTLEEMSIYYKDNWLKPNPNKTQACTFHLKNKEAKRKIRVIWEGVEIENIEYPKFLGVTLDRILSFKHHCESVRQKTHARNNLIRKLTGTSWEADPNTVRTSALALCYSTAEYAAPVWARSCYAKKVDIALNETYRIISGCLKPTPVEEIQALSGIAPPDIRREIASEIERHK